MSLTPPDDSAPLSVAAILRELRRHLAELEAAEEVARRKRRYLMGELDALVVRLGETPLEHAARASDEERDSADPMATPDERAEGSAAPRQGPFRVLIADDSISSGRVAQRIVERLGYAVDLVFDGVEAVERVSRECYDAVLMDCKMPRMDGYQATRAIRQLPGEAHAVPVIALTANNLAGDDMRCFVAGMDDYLAKPVHPDRLEETLARWVQAESRRRPA